MVWNIKNISQERSMTSWNKIVINGTHMEELMRFIEFITKIHWI